MSIGELDLIPHEAINSSLWKKVIKWIPFWWMPRITPRLCSVLLSQMWIAGYSAYSPVATNDRLLATARLMTSLSCSK